MSADHPDAANAAEFGAERIGHRPRGPHPRPDPDRHQRQQVEQQQRGRPVKLASGMDRNQHEADIAGRDMSDEPDDR